MIKEEYGFIKKTLNMLLFLVIIVIVVGVCSNVLRKDNKEIKIININKDWSINEDKIIDNVDVTKYDFKKIKANDIVLSYKMDKEYDIIFPTIIIKTDNYLKEVWLEDRKLEINVDNNNGKTSKQIINEYYSITLPEDYRGKTLQIKIKLKKNESKKAINKIFVISESDYVFYQIRNNDMAFLIAMSLIILGIIITVIGLTSPLKTNRIKKMFWTGLTYIYISVVMMAQYGILELVVNSNRFIRNLKFTGMFLSIPAVLMIAYNTFKNPKYKRIMYIHNIVLYVMYFIIRILNNLDVISYAKVLIMTQLVALITLVLLLIYNIASYIKVNVMEKLYTFGMSICYIECIVGIILSYLKFNLWSKYSIHFVLIGVFTLFAVTIVYYAFIVDGYLNNITEKRMLYTLAYTDPLTGVMNRAKYEEIVEGIEKNKLDTVMVIMFDLNNLKKLNDTTGHEAGDVYIKLFAESLSRTFEEYVFLGRIGGDEFVIILDKKITEIENHIKRMSEIFKELVSDKKFGYEASFAYGYATDVENVSIKELINIADERMYGCKAKQKSEKKV